MIEQWIHEDERELEARCARFRNAQRALECQDGEQGEQPPDEMGPAA